MARPSSTRWLQVFATLLGLAVSVVEVRMARAAEPRPAAMCEQTVIKGILIEVADSVLAESKIDWKDPSGNHANPMCQARSATLDSAIVAPLISKLKKQGGRVIAEPTVMTVAGQQVTFKSGGEILLDEKDAVLPERTQFVGTTFKATPWQLSTEQQLLTVTVEQTSLISREGAAPGLRSRTFSAAMMLPMQKTAILWLGSPAAVGDPKESRKSLVAFLEVEEVDKAATALPLAQPRTVDQQTAPAPADENYWQFRMSAVLLTIANADLQKVGIDWNREAKDGTRMAIVEADDIAATVKRLKENGGQIVSRPQLMTIDGQEATVQMGHGIRARASDAEGVQADFKNQLVASTLTATPTRLSANRARLDLVLENGVWIKGPSPIDETAVPILSTGKFRCRVELESHKSAIISVPCLSEPSENGDSPCSFVALINIDSVRRNGDNRGGELAELRGEISQLREQIARLTEPTASRTRAAAPIAASAPRRISVDRAVATEPVETATVPTERLITKVYSVADLVVSVPDIRAERGGGQAFRVLRASEAPDKETPAPRPAAKAEFGPLVELITETIEPESWKKDGRNMVTLNANLGLVVTQTAAVHEQIASLISELRSKQDQMVQVEIEVYSVSSATVDEVGLNLTDEGCTLTPEEAKAAREAYRQGANTKILSAPRVTLLNKQMCEVETGISSRRNMHLMLLGTLVEESEPKTIRLNLAVNAKDAADAVRHGVSTKLASGETHVLDITDRLGPVGNEQGVPMLNKIPYVSRLFRNVGPAKDQRTLLFIKPTVRTVSEEP